jgi:hypothetical protein
MKMNRVSIDVFAETNPAFCALILFKFCQGYYNETKEGVPFPLVLLPLPIILSNDLSKSFEHTIATTGFFRWIEKNPEILIDLSKRINDSSEFIKPAIEFGLYKKIIQVDNSGFLTPIKSSINNRKKPELDYLFKYAERLGNWIGQVNSTKTIYNHLGIHI